MSLPSNAQIRLDLPAQPLAQALTALGSVANLNIYFDATIVEGLQAPALKADLSPDDALARLLAGTQLHAVRVDENTFRVVAAPAQRHAESHDGNSGGAYVPPPVSLHLASAGPGAASGAANTPSETDSKTQLASAASTERDRMTEVIVTAQKREERLLDTPQSVSVLSGDALANMGAVQFSDYANTVPGLSFTTTGVGYTQISLRGVTSGFDVGSTVGVYVDDVPYGSSSGFAQGGQVALDVGLFDIDRIEILRGPQGTLYGASTMGGLIKYVTKQPESSRFGVDMQTGVSATHDGGINYNGAIAVNEPIVADKAAVRASAYYSHDGGYIDNVALGQTDVNRSSVYGGRLDLLFTPVEGLSVRLGGFLQNISRNGQGAADYLLTGVPAYGPLDQHRMVMEPFEQQFRLGSAKLAYDMGPATLTSISSYQSMSTQITYDLSGAYVPLLSVFGLGNYSAVGLPQQLSTDKFTQEIRFASNGTGTFQWLFGGFYTHESSTNTQSFSLRDPAGLPAPNTLYFLDTPSIYKETAGFADLTYRVTNQFDVSGGLRYARNQQTYTQNGSGAFGITTPTRESSQGVFTYLANARYHFTDNATGYLRYATGYRPGGPNYVLNDPATGQPVGPPTFKPDRLRSYEAGFKTELADRRLGIDAAVYYIDWKDMHVATIAGGFSVIANAGSATVRGAELTLTGRPIRDFLVTGAFAYQRAYLTEDAADLGGKEGERLPNVPRFTAALNADYSVHSLSLLPGVGATLRYVTDRFSSFNGSTSFAQYRLPAYATVDVRSGLTLGPVSMQLYVHNLFDRHGELSAFSAYSAPGTTSVAILEPRTVGISATTHF